MDQELDRIIRERILGGEPDLDVVHPLWRASGDSGLYRAMVQFLDQQLANKAPFLDGEDLMMTFLMEEPGQKSLFREAGRTTHKSLFRHPPVTLLGRGQQLWRFLIRKVNDHVVRETGRRRKLATHLPDAPTTPRLWDLITTLLASAHPLVPELEQDLRRIAHKSVLAHHLIDALIAGESIGSISHFSGVKTGSSSGGVRWVKGRFIPAVRAYIEDHSELMRVIDVDAATRAGSWAAGDC